MYHLSSIVSRTEHEERIECNIENSRSFLLSIQEFDRLPCLK
jgi:hypothetical protein